MATIDILKRDKAQKRIRTIVERTDKASLLTVIWLLDRAWSDPNFKCPKGFDFPDELFGTDMNEGITVWGWELESLINEILCWPEKPGRRRGNTRSWELTRRLVNALRALENYEYAVNPKVEIFREIDKIGYRQFRWQSKNWQGAKFVRWWSILSDERLSEIFEEKTGTTLRNFVTIGWVWNLSLNERPYKERSTLAGLRDMTERDVDAFIRSCAMPLDQAISDARTAKRQSLSVAYVRGILRQRPLLLLQNDSREFFIRPMEKLLRWRVSSGLYYDVIGATDGSRLIGESFENYVVDTLRAKFPNFYVQGELKYGSKKRPKKSPDVIVSRDNSIKLLCECKSAKMSFNAQFRDEGGVEKRRVVEELAKGVVQVCSFEQDLKNGIEGVNLSFSKDTIPIVVTLEDFVFFGEEGKKGVFKKARQMAKQKGLQFKRLEDEKILLCTISELEFIATCFDQTNMFRLLTRSLDREFEGMALSGVWAECKFPKLENPEHPLSHRVDEIFDFYLQAA